GPGAVDAPPGPIEVTAAGGDAWIQVRAGSATGRVLHEGILPVGQTLRFDRRTIWVRTGAAAFTVISRGDETLLARDELIGTVEVLVTPRGLSPA
ncbi:MAG: RodZ domain-containing protein, partial [Gaiellales bacterium]